MRLKQAEKIIRFALKTREQNAFKPMTVAVLDAGGHLVALTREDGSSMLRPEIAQGKARGAIAMGIGTRALHKRAEEQPYFIGAMNALSKGSLVPVPGGVLVRNKSGVLLGAVGVTGDTSENDEVCALAGVDACGYIAEP